MNTYINIKYMFMKPKSLYRYPQMIKKRVGILTKAWNTSFYFFFSLLELTINSVFPEANKRGRRHLISQV